MSDMNDQQAQQPRGGTQARGTAAPGAAPQNTAATADTARGYVPRPAPATTMSRRRAASQAAPRSAGRSWPRCS